jgi:DNA helicase-2/ATP-dependent DNA helicase PcrA
MADKLENCFLVQAPAGSGKTTKIRAMVTEFLASNQRDQLLCITYTNRAKDELSKYIDSPRVFIGTIHFFLQSFMKQYFKHEEMLTIYFEMFDKEIIQRINEPKDTHQTESNKKYFEKFGDLSYPFVKNNIRSISYNESSFTSLYYGGLSHDDLIYFSYTAFRKHPILQRCLAAKYQTIFIDEYQDSFAEVLKLFYMSIQGTTTKLYLFGDRMQQIYKNYDGSFENELTRFDQSIQLGTNYRSIPVIVELLNNIYNNATNKQHSSKEMEELQTEQKPLAIFCNDIQKKLNSIIAQEPKHLVLRLFNKDRFKAIDAEALYNAFNKMEAYAFHKQKSAVDVLITNYADNPDALMKLLFFIEEIHWNYSSEQYGLVIQKLRAENAMIAPESCMITSHQEKLDFQTKLKVLFALIENDESSIGDVFNHLKDKQIIQDKYCEEIIQMPDYESVWGILFKEVLNIAKYLRDPTVSTQHGVKGESHDSVIFVAETNKLNPIVHMYEFFDIWSKIDITLEDLNKMYYSYSKDLEYIQAQLGIEIGKLNKETFSEYEQYLIQEATNIVEKYTHNQIFRETCLVRYENFLDKKNVTAAKECFKESTKYGIISANKLFYVGCSRARKDLTILIDQTKIVGDKEDLKKKLEKIGFEVKNQEA